MPKQTKIQTIQRLMHIHERNSISPAAVNQLSFSTLIVPVADDAKYEWLHANILPFQEGFSTWKFADRSDWKHVGYSMWKRMVVKRGTHLTITADIIVIFQDIVINIE